jgi:hypothetical protein
MRHPRLAGFRVDMRETAARRGAGNANQVLAGGALNLAPCVATIALQRLIAMGAIEFEFSGIHKLHPHHAQTTGEKYIYGLFILSAARLRI